jgi:hypothetical protein
MEVLVPYERFDLITASYELGAVEHREETEAGVRLRLSVPKTFASKLSTYAVGAPTDPTT